MLRVLTSIAAPCLGLLLVSACGETAPPPTVPGVARELAEHRARTISDVAYRIELRVPAGRDRAVEGRSVLRFAWSDPDGHDLVLDFARPAERVQRVLANRTEVAWSAVEDHVVIPASALYDGLNEVELSYTAGDDALNRNDDFLYTLFVPDRAHFSLPMFDQPDLKATVEWTLEVPADWKAVANGPLLDESRTRERRTLRFLPSRPIPTYLFAFAAGVFEEDYEVVDGRVIRMFHRETDREKAARNRDAIFQLHGRALAWLEEYTGIPYPFQKFDFVLIPSFQYGGMEHPGGILYNASGLMLDESATQGQILGRASVIAHETAHMWFGDLVTMRWFDDVWTKEVFANFMAAKIVHPAFPQLDHELRFLTAHHPSAYGVDRTPGANAIRQPLDNLREAGTLYGAIIYQKAPIVMRHLEERVGVETFRDGLREYLSGHAYGNATWPDLIAILDRSSPEDLASWSRVWVEEPGRPTVRVTREGADVVVRQDDPAGRGRVWPQTLRVRLAYASRDTVATVELGAEPARLQGLATDDLRFVLPNGSGLEYGLFLLDDASLAALVEDVSGLPSPRSRGAAWVTLWDQVLEGRLPPAPFLDRVLEALPREDVELNVSALSGYLARTYWDLLPDEERLRRAAEVERVVWAGVTGERPATARATFLGTFRSVALTPEGVGRLRRLWEGAERLEGLPLSESDLTALAGALALREVDGWAGILEEQEGRIDNPDRRARFHFVRPSLDADPGVRSAFFASLADPANREREPWVLDGLRNLHHPLRAEASLPFVLPALEMIEEIQRTGDIFFPGRWLDATLGGHNEPEAAETVRRFLEANPDLPPRLRAKVLQSADGVWRAAEIVHGWQDPAGLD
ncbi:MAG TPA: M1 family aminopeptidase [Longimicrobiales bacterium]|nr:M1 family aminopeptidase [Longimicrobiales bacterium]